jgi:hypothetical protein
MSYAKQMIDADPRNSVDAAALAATIDALSDCEEACSADAAADLGAPNLAEMVYCIRLCLDCTDVCGTVLRVLSRRRQPDVDVPLLLEACAALCKSCGDECERHAKMHAHCRVCGEACRRCEKACRDYLDVLKAPRR